MQSERRARVTFLVVWALLCAIKLLIAARLPLFVDEAFYWQESRHPAWAYSDLPGLTAWLIAVGSWAGGTGLLAVRWPFLMLGAALPWLMMAAARPLGAARVWQVGLLVTLFPLSGLLGVLALPDVPMTFTTACCLLGGVQLLQAEQQGRSSHSGVLWLALGLVLGGLSHYRFVAVIAVGFIVLLGLPQGRALLRRPRVWWGISAGALAWLPLLWWNLQHGEAGWRFQFVDRHPWALHADGFNFLLVQALLATPLLAVALVSALRHGGPGHPVWQRWFALSGGVLLVGFFLLGFVADAERVSFHWPLPAWLALLVLAPLVLASWSPFWRRATWALLVLAMAAAVAVPLAMGLPSLRNALAASSFYPENFSGWHAIATAVRERLATLPPGTRVVADNFKLGAQLGFAFDDPDIPVLDHPLNHHHGRARQLALWGLQHDGEREHWQLLVVGASDVKFSALLAHYQSLCARFGPLPPPDVIEVDHGARRILLLALPPGRTDGTCVTPTVAHVDLPEPGAQVEEDVLVRGWAVKDGVGISRVTVLLDGQPLAQADYGASNPWVVQFLRGASRDPNLPNIQFETRIRLPEGSDGRHRIGLELEGGDGSVERWSGPRVQRAATRGAAGR